MWLVWHANVFTDSYLITFLSRQPIVNRLRASGRKWLRTIISINTIIIMTLGAVALKDSLQII